MNFKEFPMWCRSKLCLSLLVGFALGGASVPGIASSSWQPLLEASRWGICAKPPPVIPLPPLPPLPPGVQEIVQTFPAGEEVWETAWLVRWTTLPGHGLCIHSAWFKRTPKDPWISILGDTRLAQAFVPYHRGNPRFWDVSYHFPLDPLTRADAGPFGELLKARPGDRFPTVVKELRDCGLLYRHPVAGGRRSQALVLWASLAAANYRYLIEYSFADCGTITCRCGASGHNLPGSEREAHMHNAMWRIDVNLGDAAHNCVLLCEHLEEDGPAPGTARSRQTLIEQECGLDWDPFKFTYLRVLSTRRKNAQDQPWSYDLVPLRHGNSRHYGRETIAVPGGKLRKEDCTLHDFWVTQADPTQITYHLLPEYVRQKRPLRDTDIVLWYNAPAHHEPRSEDGLVGKGSFQGATLVMWSGFELRPRNFFDRTPFFPYEELPSRRPFK
jgi:hypothetical protein